MKILNSFFSAFLMYSRIPMPRVEWKEENRSYALCFFPLVGAVIGALLLLWQNVCNRLEIDTLLYAVVAVLIPILVTGGIHMDGYMDVSDALACMGNREKRLEVMKDSRIGAFAAIRLVCYMLLEAGLFSVVTDFVSMAVIALLFVLSRAYSGLSVVLFKNATGRGSLMSFSKAAHRRITIFVELMVILGCYAGMLLLNLTMGLCGIAAGLLVFLYYREISYKYFGGITGDLAGYFLQLSELVMMVWVVAGRYVTI